MSTRARIGHLLPLLLLGAAAALFFLLQFDPRSDATIAGNDAVGYSLDLESGDAALILDAHHPLFHLIAWGIEGAIGVCLPGNATPGIWALRVVSALGGAAALMVLFSAARRHLPAWLALLLALLLGSLGGVRFYASVGESYLPAYAVQLALCLHLFSRSRENRPAALVGCIALSVLALLLRQDSVLVIPFVFLFLLSEHTTPAGRARRALAYLLWSATITALCYALFYLAHFLAADEPHGPIEWLLHLARQGRWGGWGHVQPAFALACSLQFTAVSWDYGLLHAWPGRDAFDALFALRWAIFALPISIPLLLAARRCQRVAILCLGAFLVPRLLFFSWWQPGNTEYHLGQWVPLFALLTWALWNLPRRRIALAALLLLAIGWNVWSNERFLCWKLREHNLARHVEQCERWASKGYRIRALDAMISYALRRFGPVPHEPFFGPSADELARQEGATAPERLLAWAREPARELRAQISSPNIRGVVFVRDDILPGDLGTPPWGIDHLMAAWKHLLLSPAAAVFQNPHGQPPDAPWERCWALRFDAR